MKNSKGLSKKKQKTTKKAKIGGPSSQTSTTTSSTAAGSSSSSQSFDASTPCRMIAQLELKPRQQPKQSRLLSSKSLSQLVPRSLFFRKSNKPATNDAEKQKQSCEQENKLTTTKSFPNGVLHSTAMNILDQQRNQLQQEFINRVNSASLIGLSSRPSTSSSGFFGNQTNNNSTLLQPNLSPIVGLIDLRRENNELSAFSPSSFGEETHEIQHVVGTTDGQNQNTQNPPEEELKKRANGNKFKPFKKTTLVLRDVKNSIGLRMRTKLEGQAFSKLTEELATPPTKLYSPFNIYTDSHIKDPKSKRRLNLNNEYKPSENDQDGDCSFTDDGPSEGDGTPKYRIAMRHKKHLMQANKFTFVSPTGKLRETVKDVEHFQQCIEDISKAIRSRDQSR